MPLESSANLDIQPPVSPAAARILKRCDELARLSEHPDVLTRTFLSPPLAQAHSLVAEWMRDAGLQPRVDELGNLVGHYPAASDPIDGSNITDSSVFLLGSHLDTVPNAGKYDGMLGVILAIEAVAALKGRRLPFAIDVFGFSDEEGVRFGTPYLGSRAVAGCFDPALLELVGRDGLTMRQAMEDFGLDPDAWNGACYDADRVLGYFEVHIEQGPVLEAEGLALGVVTAIAGQSRWRLRFEGQAGHAGTQPMAGRLDALTAASEWVLGLETYAREIEGLKATVGFLEVGPNAPNVVPGEVACSLDVRHADDTTRELAVQEILALAEFIGARRGITVEAQTRGEQGAVPMDAALGQTLRRVLDVLNLELKAMDSGAGHDAVVISVIAPCAMLFVRTPGGASHCPDERVDAPDVELALRATVALLQAIAQERETMAVKGKESHVGLV